MMLSENLFDGVLTALGAEWSAVSPSGGGRRGPRVSAGGRVVIVPCPEGVDAGQKPPLSVPMRDLSRGGVRFLMPRRLPLDTQFVLLLPRSAEAPPAKGPTAVGAAKKTTPSAPLAVECTVIYWQPLARELFAIGGQFTRVLSGGEFQAPAHAPRLVLPGHAAGDPGAEAVETAAAAARRAAS
jgi:hypothetical protein